MNNRKFKNLGEMRRFMGGSQNDVFTKSNDRIGHRELKRGSGKHSGIDGMLLDPTIGELLESMLEGMPDDAEVEIISKEMK
jgi:hypothetical protein